jgi:hypothetical protein
VDLTTAAGTNDSVIVADNSGYTLGEEIEVGLDGVPREVTRVEADGVTVSFGTPGDQLAETSTPGTVVRSWVTDTIDLRTDLHLQPGSVGIDAGDNSAVPLDVTTDLDGSDRFVDDPATTDSGGSSAPVVDMGAYEYQ